MADDIAQDEFKLHASGPADQVADYDRAIPLGEAIRDALAAGDINAARTAALALIDETSDGGKTRAEKLALFIEHYRPIVRMIELFEQLLAEETKAQS